MNKNRIVLYMAADCLLVLLSLFVAIALWRQGFVPGSRTIGLTDGDFVWFFYVAPAAVLFTLAVNSLLRLYSNLWKYASIDEIIKIFIASVIVFTLLYFYDLFLISPMGLNLISRRMYFIAWAFGLISFAFIRFGYRVILRLFVLADRILANKSHMKRTLVVGASFAGYGVIKTIQNERSGLVVVVVDPDLSKHNTSLLGVRVHAGLENIERLAREYAAGEIIIAMPDADPYELRLALDYAAKTDCRLKILPPMSDVAGAVRDVNVSDILHREEIQLDTKNISDYLRGRTVLVTGGGGSIGCELVRQIIKFMPEKIIIFDINENNAFELICELKNSIYLRLGSIQDMPRLREVFREFKPDVVFHTAAHKHVSVIEENIAEAVKNNVFGTYNAALAAREYNAERFVLISSDKAVNPANVYGATKRAAELIVQSMAVGSKTRFVAVRFGNVLWAAGSVLRLFARQIALGGPVIVTGPPDMVRFFMTIPEACRLVLQAASIGRTGEVLVLDMGEPVKIYELAEKMIKLSGYKPHVDIDIVCAQKRPGDKVYEELILEAEKERMQVTCHKKIFITKPLQTDYDTLAKQLARLKNALDRQGANGENVRKALYAIAPWDTPRDAEQKK